MSDTTMSNISIHPVQSLDQYRSSLKSVPTIGSLVWFGVEDGVKIEHAGLLTRLSAAGFSAFAPPEPRDSDVFTRVCSKSHRKKVQTSNPNVFVNYMLRPVGKDGTSIWRRIVAERVDTKGKKLGYSECTDLIYSDSNSTILPSPKDNPDSVSDEITLKVISDFNNMKGCVNSYVLREQLRKILTSLDAITVRNRGAVFFIPGHDTEIVEFEKLVDSLGGGVIAHSLPLVDNNKQREMVREAFESESVDDLDELIEDVYQSLNGPRGLTQKGKVSYILRLENIKKKVTNYSSVLEQTLSLTETKMDVAQKLMLNVITGEINDQTTQTHTDIKSDDVTNS